MKKLAVIAVAGWLAVAGAAAGEPPARHLFVGASAGSFSIWSIYGANRLGGELGVQLGRRWVLTAEIAYGTSKYVSRYQTQGYRHESTTELRGRPVFVGIHFLTPVNGTFTPYLGAGAEFFSAKLISTDTYAFEGMESETHSDTVKLDGIMPVVKIGLEGTLAGRFVLFGEVKQGLGKSSIDEGSEGYTSTSEVPVGGTEIKAGFRIYF